MAERGKRGGGAVMEAPEVTRSHDGLIQMAGQTIEYWFDQSGVAKGADVAFWMNKGGGGPAWSAAIRWKPDTLSGGTGGQFEMTYPNPSGGEYRITGRQQLQPLVDQAVRLGSDAVFGDAFIT